MFSARANAAALVSCQPVKFEAVVADLAGPDETVERAQRLLQRGVRVERVRLVEVDRVNAEPGQRGLERPGEVPSGQPDAVRVGSHRETSLGGEHDGFGEVSRSVVEPTADDLLRDAGRVDIGSVDQGAAGLDETVQLRVRFGFVGFGAEGHGAERERQHHTAAVAKGSVVHSCTLGRSTDNAVWWASPACRATAGSSAGRCRPQGLSGWDGKVSS